VTLQRRLITPAPALILFVATCGPGTPEPPDPGLSENPIVRDIFTADPAGLVYDGRLYIFAGRDEAPPTHVNFTMREWHAFSSADPRPDPDAWEHHGAPLSLEDFEWADANAWAAEVVRGPDGRFYWYVSARWREASADTDRMAIGVAVADHPLGPYRDATGSPLITSGLPNASRHNIDPTVLVNDEHGIYLYWGSFWSPRFVRLKENMIELDGDPETPEGLDAFWEAPWIIERDGIYYNAYASNANIDDDECVTSRFWACIRYATADHPAGPWVHQGIVLGQVSSTTNHPAIVEFPEGSDEWWMVYHTADLPDGGNFCRSVAIDRLFFEPDGSMRKVVQTRFPAPESEIKLTDDAARTATAICSYTSERESCDALRSPEDPTSSDIPGPTLGTRWSTWPEVGEHWIEYAWDRPVRVATSEIYWFQDSADGDGVGVKRPTSWTIEYHDGNRWIEVSDPSEYGTNLDRPNITTFRPVTTTRLRAVLQTRTDAEGVGALQWKILSPPPVAMDSVEANTRVGVPPTLPATINLRFDDGARLAARVRWRPLAEEWLAEPGTFTLGGAIENSSVEAEAIINVRLPR